MNDHVLRTSLLDLLHVLGEARRGVLLAGGYGLYLKQLHMAQAGHRTLIPVEMWPAPRATQDLDLLLSAEIVADVRFMGAVRAGLDQLGYTVVAGSEYLQFARTVAGAQTIKIDLLTAQLDMLQDIASIKADSRRARPVAEDRAQLHAHPTDGALALDESPLEIEIAGTITNGESSFARVRIPHPFTYLLMKLTAYRDRRNDARKDLGRHHALDVFRIVAMLTEDESNQVRQYIARFTDNTQVRSCVGLVRSDFAHATAPALLAMREHPLWQNDPQMDVFIEVINELLS
ncbi:MAG: hypothetical protein IT440_00640 [Phycisphaeraceae bacterium]|nr:hypothetical protein [Phycisphaeraceae bacterium]